MRGLPGATPERRELTSREREVLALVGAGLSSREIAQSLGISPLTVRKHRANMLAALSLQSAAALRSHASQATQARHPAENEVRQASLASLQALTQREREVARHLTDGNTSKQIGKSLGISDLTVRKHRENIFRKLGIGSSVQLMKIVRSSSE